MGPNYNEEWVEEHLQTFPRERVTLAPHLSVQVFMKNLQRIEMSLTFLVYLFKDRVPRPASFYQLPANPYPQIVQEEIIIPKLFSPMFSPFL